MANFAEPGTDVECACAADTAQFEVLGQGVFSGHFRGKMSVHVGPATTDDAEMIDQELEITGHETEGMMDQIGEVKVSHDFSRPAPLSRIRQIDSASAFPAMQEMYVNVNIAVAAFPGLVLRNVSPGVLRCESQNAFPPQNARYVLQAPLELEDVARPGTVIARMLSYTAVINPEAPTAYSTEKSVH